MLGGVLIFWEEPMEESCRQAVAAIYTAFCGASGDDIRRQANAILAYALDHGSISDGHAHFVLRELIHGNSLEFDAHRVSDFID
jgi:hypothetical protein